MATKSGIVALKRGVAQYFLTNSISATVHVGWKPRNRKDNQGPGGASRVVFIPGEFDPSTGAPKPLRAGLIDRRGPQNHIDLNPRLRDLAWWHHVMTCSVWGVDPDFPQDEERQIEATEALLELTIQGIHNAVDPTTNTNIGFGNVEEWGEPYWTVPPGEQAFGRELTFGLTLLVPIFDQGVDLAFPAPQVEFADPPFLPI